MEGCISSHIHRMGKQPIEDNLYYGPPIMREILTHLASIQGKSHIFFYMIVNHATITSNVLKLYCSEAGQGKLGRSVGKGSYKSFQNKFDLRLI